MEQSQCIKWAVVVSIAMGGQFTAHAADSGKSGANRPVQIHRIGESSFSRVVLTAQAAERLGIATAVVREIAPARRGSSNNNNDAGIGKRVKVIPYQSVIYDLHGETWIYTNPEPLTYVRHAVNVNYIDDNNAFLLKGPPLGTSVVTYGVAELFGAEFGIGK